MKQFFLFVVLFINSLLFAQTKVKGQVIDYDTTIPIAFAKITYESKTFTTDWEGKFNILVSDFKKPVYVFYKGYYDKSAYPVNDNMLFIIKLITNINLPQNEIYSDNKVNKIIKKVYDNRFQNDPEKALSSFEYKNYEYLQISANPDSISNKIDTIYKKNIFGKRKIKLDSTNYKFKRLVAKNHIYQTEKVNLIQHNNKDNKETIIATRMAGFKEPIYEYLGLKLISYSVYENPFEILEIPLQNPISNIGRRLYVYNLIDSVAIQGRKTYRIYFQPKKIRSNRLRGLLYIDAETFAIAKANYRIYGIANIDATYTFDYLKEHNIWFTNKRKFFVKKGSNNQDIKILGGTMEFNSSLEETVNKNASDRAYINIESTPYDIIIGKPVNIQKPQVKIDLPKSSFNKSAEYWKEFTKDTIDNRKLKTYVALDSLSTSERIEHKIFLGKKIINGYFPINILDVDLRSLIKYNNFEGFRFGIGAITNSKLSENYRIGGYVAYGLKDEKFKYGFEPSYLLNKKTETWISTSYSDDLSELAETNFVTDSRKFRLYDPRPINISTFYNIKTAAVILESKIFTKLTSYFSLSHNQIQPLFDYTFVNKGENFTNYNIASAMLAFQWSPFSNYMDTPMGVLEIEKRHPKFSFQFTQTLPEVAGSDFVFSKLDFKTHYEIPFLSGQKSMFVFQGGISFGDVPLTHLYSVAPNNINKDAILKRITFAGKNSFETMYYNEFFSNRYASLQLKHTFNKINLGYKITPEISVVTKMAWGQIDNKNQHVGLPFKSLENGFFESGLEANKIYKGLGLTAFYRYGPYQLARFDDNLSIKISYYIDLGI
uniref:DUF5686 family protein n=1 Tax=Flavobacterium sp. TaxID=239 RepID=UPI0040493D7A